MDLTMRCGSETDTECIHLFMEAEMRRQRAENDNDWQLSHARERHDTQADYLAEERRRAQAALLADLHLKPAPLG